jgi:hypothetical protein
METYIPLMLIILAVIILTLCAVGYVLESKIDSLRKEMTMKDVVKYINENKVYIRDKNCNILKYNAHIASFNNNDFQKIIIDIDHG